MYVFKASLFLCMQPVLDSVSAPFSFPYIYAIAPVYTPTGVEAHARACTRMHARVERKTHALF